MSSFFRDSNLFATRNNKPLFQAVTNNSKISFEKLSSKHKTTPVVVKPFSEGLKLERNSVSDTSKASPENNPMHEEQTDDCENGESENDEANDDPFIHSNPKIGNNSIDEDDDVEITEVRDLDQDNYGGSDSVGETSNTLNNDHDQDQDHQRYSEEETLSVKKENNDKMDNVSMEYLLNTISHLNEKNKILQKELKTMKHENENIASNLKEKNESISLLKHKVFKFRCTVENSNLLLKDLKVKFVDSNNKKDALVEDLKKTKESILKEHEFLYSLKTLVSNLKTQNSINESKITQKDQRIANLNQKANDLAGRLSEEKIKNSQLSKEITEVSKKYEAELFKCANQNNQLIKSILDQRAEFKTTWVEFVRDFNTKLCSINSTNSDSLKKLKLSLDDNFNDLALRFANLGAATDSIKSSIIDSNEKATIFKEELVSALSSIDKNIVTNSNKNFGIILQKLNEKCTSQDLECFSTKVLDTIDRNLKNEEEISLLHIENKKLVDVNARKDKQITVLNARMENKVEEIGKLTRKISKLNKENAELTNNQLSVIKDLQKERENLSKEIAKINETYANIIKDYENKLESSRELAKQVEEKNVSLFNQEKKKVDSLQQRLGAFDKTCEMMKTERVMLQNKLDSSKESSEAILKELNELKQVHDEESKKVKELMLRLNEASNDLGISNADINMMKKAFKEKESYITDLSKQLAAKENDLAGCQEELNKIKQISEQTTREQDDEISKLKKDLEKLKGDLEKLCKAKPRKIFPESRTSTLVKQEEVKELVPEVMVKIEQNKDNKSKKAVARKKTEKKLEPSKEKELIKPKAKKPSVNTRVTKPKRKLISSSQSSIRSSQSLREKKQQDLTKNILQDLDIFNEFEAIDKLGTILKPGW